MGAIRSIVGLAIALLFLGYGLARLGVGGALVAQSLGLLDLPDLADVVSETRQFIDVRKGKLLFPFSVPGYLAYVMVMGAVLSAGATGALARRRWGQRMIGIYLVMHAALFVNFQEINPKIRILAATVAMFVALVWLRPYRSPR